MSYFLTMAFVKTRDVVIFYHGMDKLLQLDEAHISPDFSKLTRSWNVQFKIEG